MQKIINELQKLADPEKAIGSARFFKTGPGEYGEGDVFIGVNVPKIRQVAKKFEDTPKREVLLLLQSEIHEYRLTALIILIAHYEKANKKEKRKIYEDYLSNTKYINNWDLVDVTTPRIVGDFVYNNKKEKKTIMSLSKSDDLWERRIAVLSTLPFIKNKDFSFPVELFETLLEDKHDLMHKAVGWMLREIGKKDLAVLRKFLDKYHKQMPRTMLRYSIERLKEKERKQYMQK